MKKIILALNLLFSFYMIKGQNACEANYIAFKKGVSIELTNYNKKGKINTVQRQKINSIEAIDFALGQGSDFNTTYTDADGNTIVTDGCSQAVTGQEFGIYINENVVSGTGRFKDITTTSGGTYGLTMDKVTGAGFGRIDWAMTF